MREGRGVIRIGLAFVLLLGALSLVIWRQSRALSISRAVDELRREAAVLDAERTELTHRIQRLESRGRILEAAAELGLRVPSGSDLVILPLEASPAPEGSW